MKEVVIIGGGIAGLSAGIFAQKQGFQTTILEKNTQPGGECAGWDRRGYHIDGCIHWLVSTKEGTPLYELWRSVGALDGVDIYHPETFMSIECGDDTVHFYRDLERLRESWKALSPEDSSRIDDFCSILKKLQTFEMPDGKPADMMGLWEKLKLMHSMKDAGMVLQKYGKVPLTDYAKTFKHPALREAVGSFVPEGYAAAFFFFALATFTKGSASIPMGGSKQFALRMAQRYLQLGGRLETSCEVTGLDIEGSLVKGVSCSRGRSFDGDYVIAACDAAFLFDTLLGGKYTPAAYRKRFADRERYPVASEVMVALGFEGVVNDVPRALSFPTEPFQTGSRQVDRITVKHYNHEPDFAPQGCSVYTCDINQFPEDYEVWDALSRDLQSYRQEKQRIGEAVRKAMETRFPEMQGKLQVLDVVTPKTYERWCNAYRGGFMAFIPTVGAKSMEHSGKIKGIRNLRLTGQWLQPPGGLPVAAVTGKQTVMRLCRDEGIRFVQ